MSLSDDRKAAIAAYLGETGYTINDLEATFWADMLANGLVPAESLNGSPTTAYALVGTWAQLVVAHAATPFANNTNLFCTSGLGFTVRPVGGLLMVATPQIGKQTISSSSGVVTVDMHSGYYSNELTLTENVTSWSFTNLPASGEVIEKLVPIVQHASAAKTVVSPATSGKTAGGIPWVADTTLSSREVLLLRVDSAGTVTLFPTGKQV